MAKIKKVDSQILHHTSKHVSGAVHPRLQKHVRQIPKADPRIIRRKEDERLTRLKDKKSTKERDEHEKDIEEKARYEFPFDKGYLKWLNDEIGFARLTGKEQQEVAESSKYQTAYERQSGLSHRDGSKLGGGGGSSIAGFTADYVNWLSGIIKGWDTKTLAEQTELANGSMPQRHYTAITGLDPKDNSGSKAPSYTKAYRSWVATTFSPKNSDEEERMLADNKVQTTYKAQTGQNPTG